MQGHRDPLRHRDEAANRRSPGGRASPGRSPSIPGAARSRSSRAPRPSTQTLTCTSSTRAPFGCEARLARRPSGRPRLVLLPHRRLRPGRAKRDRGLFDGDVEPLGAVVPAPFRRPHRLAAGTGRPRRPQVLNIPLLSTADGRLFVSTATGGPGEGRRTRSTRRRCASWTAIRWALPAPPSAPTGARSRSATRDEAFACSTSPPGGCGRSPIPGRGLESGPSAPTGEPCPPGMTTGM